MNTLQNPSAPGPVIGRRGALLGVGLALGSVLAAALVRLSGVSVREPDAAPQTSRMIRFADGPEGAIVVQDALSGNEIARWQGERGFERGALRTLGRERKRRGLSPSEPFELIGRADGRLTLFDPLTTERLDLESFGPTNARVFAQLLRDR